MVMFLLRQWRRGVGGEGWGGGGGGSHDNDIFYKLTKGLCC